MWNRSDLELEMSRWDKIKSYNDLFGLPIYPFLLLLKLKFNVTFRPNKHDFLLVLNSNILPNAGSLVESHSKSEWPWTWYFKVKSNGISGVLIQCSTVPTGSKPAPPRDKPLKSGWNLTFQCHSVSNLNICGLTSHIWVTSSVNINQLFSDI